MRLFSYTCSCFIVHCDTLTPGEIAAWYWDRFLWKTGNADTACRWYLHDTSALADTGCCPAPDMPRIFTWGDGISGYVAIEDTCTLVYVRTCVANEFTMTERYVLCEDVCSSLCDSAEICFKWVDLIAPDTTFIIRPLTCREIAVKRIRDVMGQGASECITKQRAAIAAEYREQCTVPANITDTLEATYGLELYHFTLYYHDRAGRLTRTVPPQGVVLLGPTATRANHPSHTLVTSYEYNSLGQIIRTRTPDGGTSRAWYDAKSRARFAQTAEQRGRNAFSYTKYDALGRTIETGESIYTNTADLVTYADSAWYPNAITRDVFTTVYTSLSDRRYEPDTVLGPKQRYLRNRVSYTMAGDSSTLTFYSYDPHGNVEWLVQDQKGLGANYVRYTYDLISGNVLRLYYNENLGDQLTQAYYYDPDNRIVRVESSRDGAIWDRDASYRYFAHGPLRRAEYGEDSLQGADYTYTLQGWLKAVNHASLDTNIDPGADADFSTGRHAKYAIDAFGMILTHYEGDYLRKKSMVGHSPFNSKSGVGYNVRSDNLAITGRGLYNGNIAGWATNTKPNGGAQAYEQVTGEVYTYDRLNRIIASTFNVYTGTVPTGTWSTPGTFDTWYDYDANGNILKLNRHDSATAGSLMDSLAYSYNAGTNRLTYIDDATPRAANAAPSIDLEDQAPGNYSYDASGRLIGDVKEGIAAIDWTHYTKVRDVRKTAGVRLHFAYDAQGNRAKKAVAAGGSGETTYYVREAGGKVIAIYTKACLDRADFRATVGGGGGASGCIDPAFDDADHDGIADSVDNAPGVFNPTQNDADGDDTADVLDADPDGDGLLGVGDPCPYDPLNSCTGDTDSDGIPDADDPCPTWPGDCWTNPDADNDGDGVVNKEDNCPWTQNADQADTNANGVGDVCECDDEETGGCPPELAEQYVYGSETDGRVVTVRPARARDMQDHRGDTVFTRVLDKKEYELNDHLGNVRVRFGDVKKSTGTPGTSPYAIDMKGYVNYYPFGMAQPGRELSMSGGRYGYNGKEMDNEWNNAQGVAGNEGTGNAYDYGARIYDPRVGRWLSGDPNGSAYPSIGTYSAVLNSPNVLIDPDGRDVYFWDKNNKLIAVVVDGRSVDVSYRIPFVTAPEKGWTVIDLKSRQVSLPGLNEDGSIPTYNIPNLLPPLIPLGVIAATADVVAVQVTAHVVLGGIGVELTGSIAMMLDGPQSFEPFFMTSYAIPNDVAGLSAGASAGVLFGWKTKRGANENRVIPSSLAGRSNELTLGAAMSGSIWWTNPAPSDGLEVRDTRFLPIPPENVDWIGFTLSAGPGAGVYRGWPVTARDMPKIGVSLSTSEHEELMKSLPGTVTMGVPTVRTNKKNQSERDDQEQPASQFSEE